jgi:hypothetical protein
MTGRSVPWWVWLIPAALLAFAVARLPYSYYTFLRVVTCAAGLLFAFVAWERGRTGQVLAVASILFAILFNPIFPVYLRRAEWFYLDLLGAAIFATGAAFMWTKRNG